MNKILLHTITFFLLTIFVSLKVVNTHYFAHIFDESEAIVNCDICNDFQKSPQTDITSPVIEDLNFAVFGILDKYEPNKFYLYQPLNLPLGCYYNKPPPTLV